ncbi:hypothetical protein A7985_06240 [Pseudoalteromonas luteoviolacea]|uniref:Questin oxidase family protein n=1 Tax=Pseudoalteromonas luteoviolacea TaxID=43657 RepID=A0A1C0TW51_9GAMM|nr:questin oxidase family protein [Pseudoalteromonas luteoviolacea]MBQ4810059.1 questin oxidase family protein [Pseudoalteromonas luteoviolacea]OCQ23537.1 hypothetical protein A7985_06240 [Pseudoalteromonas luteoviolacea]
MDESNTLNSLLEKVAVYHPLYGGGLATHLPMVLIALSKLKAPDEILLKAFDNGLDELELTDNLDKVNVVEGVESELGNSGSYLSYLKYYQRELAENGVNTVLEKTLPSLISGIAASAFHGLIRLAYAVEANNQSEMAIALAFWSSEYQPFKLSDKTTEESCEDILARLSKYGENFRFSPGIIVDRMDEIAGLLQRLDSEIQPAFIDLSTIRQFAIKSYYLQDDFTLLHTVTGCHAFSIILPFIDDVECALRSFWKAIVVAYLSTGLAYKGEKIIIPCKEVCFDLVRDNACLSNDSHVIKLVYSCLREYQLSGDSLYYLAAHRAVFHEHK